MKKSPTDIDRHVGSRVRQKRMLIKMSQEKLAEYLGITFQQVQKYERGTNRIGASRLWELSAVLEVPVQFFFGEMAPETLAEMSRITRHKPAADPDGDAAPLASTSSLTRPETLELIRAYDRIPIASVRRRLYELTKTLATELGQLAPTNEPA